MSCDGKKKHGNGDASSSNYGECDMFDGEWMKVENWKPYYPPGSCPFIRTEPFACYENGRPDDQFLQWQWQWSSSKQTNANCNKIPRSLKATDFLERLRGKRLVFVVDSLNRNMYVSLVCILWNVIPDKSRVFRPTGSTPFESRGDMSLDYNCTVVFVWTAFLVEETNSPVRRSQTTSKPKPKTLRLDVIDEVASSVYRDADIVVFGSWHWWVKAKTNNGINYFQEGDYLHPTMETDKAYKNALNTWRKWIDKHIDANKTQVFFRGHSLSHYVGGRWNTGGHCHLEREPIMSNETYVHPSPSQAKILEDVLRRTKTPVMYLNISKLTYYRSDGHPSLYAKNYTAKERILVLEIQDCSHWCLPGVADTWNELLYASLLKAGKGSFGRL
ncbi:hypothetical protein C5167_035812 [Papaver somniferum]|nr:hypothetical protein C5167_035812 [Papaver somniferum]